jgi:hypothetical protein
VIPQYLSDHLFLFMNADRITFQYPIPSSSSCLIQNWYSDGSLNLVGLGMVGVVNRNALSHMTSGLISSLLMLGMLCLKTSILALGLVCLVGSSLIGLMTKGLVDFKGGMFSLFD